jgi:hypothetical protein
MSRQHKILLACALGFAIVFVAILMLGDQQGSRRDGGFARRYQAPSWLGAAGELFMAHTPRIVLPGLPAAMEPGTSLDLPVAPAEDGMRSARLRLERGGPIDIDYVDTTPGGPESLRQQSASLPHDGRGDPRQTSIIALRQGGQLTLRCRGKQLCVLTAK